MLDGLRCLKRLRARWAYAYPAPIQRRSLLTLAIETSCDDTCVSILSSRSKPQRSSSSPRQACLHFNEKITVENSGKGGIVPVEALSSHQANLSRLIDSSLSCLPHADSTVAESKKVWLRDGQPKEKPDFVSVTRGPGMSSNLAVGLNIAKGLATAWQIPMVGVHHMQAHALTPRLVHALATNGSAAGTERHRPDFPFLTLLVSGGHTMLLHSKGLVHHTVLATTGDTAIGDELDKCGRLLLPADLQKSATDTAFGKYLSAYAFPTVQDFRSWHVPRTRREEYEKRKNRFGWCMSTPMADTRQLAFSFAGIASQVTRLLRNRSTEDQESPLWEEERLALAQAALGTAFEHLGSRTVIALEKLRDQGVEISTLVVSGGVAANDFLRSFLRQLLDVRSFKHVELVFPPVELCTDNAAMIGWAGIEMFKAGYRTSLGCAPVRKWNMDSDKEDGGILGIDGWIRQEDHDHN